MRSEPDLAVPFGWISVLFVESQTKLLSSAESLRCVECEHDSVLLLSPEVVHKSRVSQYSSDSVQRFRLRLESQEETEAVYI